MTDTVDRVAFLDPEVMPVTEAQRVAYARLEAACRIQRVAAADGDGVFELIAQWVALAPGEVRFVYLGTQPTDDYRCVIVDRSTGLTEGIIDTALNLLK